MTSGVNAISQTQPAAQLTPEQAKLKKACQDFEAIFLRYLLEKMRDQVPKDGALPQSSEREIYEGMLNTAMAESISQQGQLGLADLLYAQVTQSDSRPPTPTAPEKPELQGR